VTRLDEITGIGLTAAPTTIAEIGLDMTRFPTPAHLVSWARFAPGISESSGRKKGNSGHGNRYLARVLGAAAVPASRTDTFLGERYRRIARRRGNERAVGTRRNEDRPRLPRSNRKLTVRGMIHGPGCRR